MAHLSVARYQIQTRRFPWQQTTKIYITPSSTATDEKLPSGAQVSLKVPGHQLVLAPPAIPPPAMLSTHLLGREPVPIQLVEVPAPHGRWSLRLVKHSRRRATHPLANRVRARGSPHCQVGCEPRPLPEDRQDCARSAHRE
jgi:hypothetical protein